MSTEPGSPQKLVYMGTANFAVPALYALAKSRHQVAAVYTQPARPAGRGMKPRPSPIERAAASLGLPIVTPLSLKEEKAKTDLASIDADLVVVAAYGLILPQAILDTPRLGCINLHGSCLPRWRGAAPIQRAILAGDRESGVTVIQMETGLDTGPMLAMERVSIDQEITASDLHDRLATLAAEMILPMVDRLAEGPVIGTLQLEEDTTYARKIEKSEGHVDWHQPVAVIDRKLRALNPWPGCWTEIGDERVRLLRGAIDPGQAAPDAAPGTVLDDQLRIACGDGVFRITELQRAGGRPLDAQAFLRGFPLAPCTRLGQPCPASN